MAAVVIAPSVVTAITQGVLTTVTGNLQTMGDYLHTNGSFTLHGTGNGTGTGAGFDAIENNGSLSLSLSLSRCGVHST